MNRNQIYHYFVAKRTDGSELIFEATNGPQVQRILLREGCNWFAEIPEFEYLKLGNSIHVERCDESAKARLQRTYN